MRGIGSFFLAGTAFGFVLTKSEALSWFRIQEMFRFHSFHMYGIIACAVTVSAVLFALMKKGAVRSLDGQPVALAPKRMGSGMRYVLGGTLFGMGWALTGACPGPQFALVGSGLTVMVLAVAGGLLGTWVYGRLRPHLPH